MEEKRFIRLEWWGVPAVLAAMLALHFGYRLSGGAMWAVLFGSVNDSVWEYVKVVTMPYLAWGAVELCAVRTPLRRMIPAKAAGMFLAAGGYVGLFYAGSMFIGSNPFLPYICALSAIILGHTASGLLIQSRMKLETWFVVAAFALLLYLAMYLTFTVSPPKFFLFQDPDTLTYGLLPRPVDADILFGEGLLT